MLKICNFSAKAVLEEENWCEELGRCDIGVGQVLAASLLAVCTYFSRPSVHLIFRPEVRVFFPFYFILYLKWMLFM